MRVLLVGNPTAQSGKAVERIERTLAAMRARGWQAEGMATEPEGRTVPKVAAAAAGYDCVVYLGGDGTFAEVAKGLLASGADVPMGMMPSGTANDQGKSFGIRSSPEALEENLDVIGDQYVIGLDVGLVERLVDGRPTDQDLFFDSAGWGFAPDVLQARNRDREIVKQVPLLREIYRDQAVYAGAALQRYLASWVEPTKFTARVIADGVHKHFDGCTDVIVKNTAIYAGSWVLDPRSAPDDGLMELVPMTGRRDMASKAIRDLAAVPVWQHHLDLLGVTHAEGLSCSELELRFERPGARDIAGQLDGEEWLSGDWFRVTVQKNRLPLVVRRDWRPPWAP